MNVLPTRNFDHVQMGIEGLVAIGVVQDDQVAISPVVPPCVDDRTRVRSDNGIVHGSSKVQAVVTYRRVIIQPGNGMLGGWPDKNPSTFFTTLNRSTDSRTGDRKGRCSHLYLRGSRDHENLANLQVRTRRIQVILLDECGCLDVE